MFRTAAELGREFRSEIAPMLKSKGFDLKISTSRRSYYHDGKLGVQITKVPTNFPVWTSEYSRWDRTKNADRLLATIEDRIQILISNNNVELKTEGDDSVDIKVDVEFGSSVRYIPYEKDENDE
jgi:hypothetical protein